MSPPPTTRISPVRRARAFSFFFPAVSSLLGVVRGHPFHSSHILLPFSSPQLLHFCCPVQQRTTPDSSLKGEESTKTFLLTVESKAVWQQVVVTKQMRRKGGGRGKGVCSPTPPCLLMAPFLLPPTLLSLPYLPSHLVFFFLFLVLFPHYKHARARQRVRCVQVVGPVLPRLCIFFILFWKWGCVFEKREDLRETRGEVSTSRIHERGHLRHRPGNASCRR